jgi:hypothetical protein
MAFYLHGESEPTGIEIVRHESEKELSDYHTEGIRKRHALTERMRSREVTIIDFGFDHGLGAHSGNGPAWRTTVVAHVRLDYLKSQPSAYVRLEGDKPFQLMESLAKSLHVQARAL